MTGTSRSRAFATISIQGALLSSEVLGRLADPAGRAGAALPGLSPQDYHLGQGQRLGEAIARSWARLSLAWEAFSTALAALPASEATATTLTREAWSLVLFAELGYGRLQGARAIEVEGRSYPISHGWGQVPVHLVGARLALDQRRRGVPGAAGASPHSLVQECLNRSEHHLWAMVTNGTRLRLLRDNASLTRQAFVEFDLEAMMADEVYDDFVVLWLTCHQSRVEGEDPASCWLEHWWAASAAAGTRALERLRAGVESAIEILGSGFLAHPANSALRRDLDQGDLGAPDYYRQVLRLVYRLLLLFVAEDRGLLHDPGAEPLARQRYARHYSTAALRERADRLRAGAHGDLWEALRVVTAGLGAPGGIPALGLAPLGGLLFSPAATPDLDRAALANSALLGAVSALAYSSQGGLRRPVDYANLGSEELGSVYESLLEQHPEVDLGAAGFALATAGGHERKTTGSYYTPTSLIVALLDSALEPVLEEAGRAPDPQAAVLALRVLDPACGSGHFLIAAAHRLARRLAGARTGEREPAPEATRAALRDVIGQCLYGIDLNPMAVELCKVALWMEALEPGKPLSFLDHHVVRGNALLGTTPALLAAGLPDAAFRALGDDEASVVSSLRRRHRLESAGQGLLTLGPPVAALAAPLAAALADLEARPDDDLAAVAGKARRLDEIQSSAPAAHARLVADAWCAAFVVPKTRGAPVITDGVLADLVADPTSLSAEVDAAIAEARQRYAFLHLHLAFPQVFPVPGPDQEPTNRATGWSGGFDVVLATHPGSGSSWPRRSSSPPAGPRWPRPLAPTAAG